MENILQKKYNNKKIFITGHTGFKGAWLLAILHKLGAITKGYALAPEYDNSLYNIIEKELNTESIINDIRNKEALTKIISDFQPDIIFHLAAQPLVRKSYVIPAETFDVNVVGTANVLEALQQVNKKCTVIIITTDKVYENKENETLYKEDDTLGGYDPYSASKACTELVVNSFRKSFFNIDKYNIHNKAIASARAGNVIGGGDESTDRIIPDIVRALAANKNITVRSANAVRPWQHVLEPLCGYLLLGALLDDNVVAFSKAYNFGPKANDHLTVKQLVEAAIKSWGSGSWENLTDPNAPHEAGLLKLDIERAINELQWHPKLNATQAIDYTIQWYKQPLQNKVAYTFEQINNYFAL